MKTDLGSKTRSRNIVRWLPIALVTIAGLGYAAMQIGTPGEPLPAFTADAASAKKSLCPGSERLVPSGDGEFWDVTHFRTPEYKNYSLEVWSGAINIPTESFDDMGPVGEDPRWDIFFDFEKYLYKTFPTVKEKCDVINVNTHGLVYKLVGSDTSLKPILLMAHQDVVPVPKDTRSEWEHEPFSADFDGEWVYGRGAGDCKNSLSAIMESLESLLKQGFKPKRTIILGLGFDEEVGGLEGALQISKYLEETYGKDSMEMIIDEGDGIHESGGAHFAFPGTGEKGMFDVQIELFTSGGHSSVPPRHTGVGIMGELITMIEGKTYPPMLIEQNPFFNELQCIGEYGTNLPFQFKQDILHMGKDPLAKERVIRVLDKDAIFRYLMETSQAIDVITGGVKINALPEKTTLKINHRVAYGMTCKDVGKHLEELVKKIAKKYGLEFKGWDDDVEAKFSGDLPTGYFQMKTLLMLDPAPVTPVGTPVWDLLAGTCRHVWEDIGIFQDADEGPKELHVSPSIMPANTDTHHYWNLTTNIFRFGATRFDGMLNYHTVNEKVQLDAHVETAAFYYQFLRNVELYGTDLD